MTLTSSLSPHVQQHFLIHQSDLIITSQNHHAFWHILHHEIASYTINFDELYCLLRPNLLQQTHYMKEIEEASQIFKAFAAFLYSEFGAESNASWQKDPNLAHSYFFSPIEDMEEYCHALIREQQYMTCFQITISYIEQYLRDVYKIISTSAEEKDHKLSDLLNNQDLQDMFGIECIFCFQCFFGFLQGLNTRNLLFHGFLNTTEFSPSYMYALLFVLNSFYSRHAQLLQSFQRRSVPTDVRQLVTQFPLHKASSLVHNDEQASAVLNQIQLSGLILLLQSSNFISPSRMDQWSTAAANIVKQNRSTNSHFTSLITLFPLLEHELRILFVRSNDAVSKWRMLCADSETLYTTFDAILDPRIPAAQDEKGNITYVSNNLYSILSLNQLHSLFDLLVWRDGTRMRDQVSHGTVQMCNMSEYMVFFTWSVAVSLCLRDLNDSETIFAEGLPQWMRTMQDFVGSYTPIFHPLRITEEHLVNCHRALEKWNGACMSRLQIHSVAMDKHTGQYVISEDNVEALTQLHVDLDSRIGMQSHRTALFSHLGTPRSEDTFHFDPSYPLPSQFTGKIGKMCSPILTKYSNYNKIAKNVVKFTQEWERFVSQLEELVVSRKAFARQRKMFYRYLHSMPQICALLQVIMLCAEYSLHDNAELHIETRNLGLQLARNLVAVISQSRNWLKTNKILRSFLASCQHELQQ